MAGVGLVNEDLEELGVGLGVLNREDISIQSGNGMEEVLELGVAEVRMDLSGVLNTSGGELEAVDSPLQVGVTLLARTKRQTLTESRLVDLTTTLLAHPKNKNDTKSLLLHLHHVDTVLLKVNNLITESKGKLLSLNGLVNVDTRERPPEASNGASKHALHGFLGNRGSVLALLDSHSGRSGDISDNDGRADATRSIRLNPGVLNNLLVLSIVLRQKEHTVVKT